MKIHLCLIIFLLVIFSCRKKCTEGVSAKINLESELNNYYKVFQKGNYWVFENQNKTKKDSIYVVSSNRHYILSSPPCEEIETIDFTLKASGHDVITGNSVCMSGQNNSINTQTCTDSLFFNGFGLMHFFTDSIYYFKPIKRLSSISLNNQLYSGKILEIYESDTLFMQEGVGIIGWKKNNDTYNLITNYLQP